MGGRLSKPRGPGGTTEASTSVGPAATLRHPGRAPFTLRMLVAPLGVITIGAIFYVYSQTTIAAAKENARRLREADGGSISWRNENARRRGRLTRPEEQTLWDQLKGGEKRATETAKQDIPAEERNLIEDGIRRARDKSNTRSWDQK